MLNDGDLVFADGTGVRWAARLQGVRVVENMTGTDFVPALFQATFERAHSYFLLGGDPLTIELAAEFARRTFPGWRLIGLPRRLPDRRLDGRGRRRQINAAKPDVLLVGMGNPLQEQWIHRHLSELRVPVCMGVGGLFDYWAGNVSRSPQLAAPAGARMALAARSGTASTGPPLSDRQPAVPQPRVTRTMAFVVLSVVCSPTFRRKAPASVQNGNRPHLPVYPFLLDAALSTFDNPARLTMRGVSPEPSMLITRRFPWHGCLPSCCC